MSGHGTPVPAASLSAVGGGGGGGVPAFSLSGPSPSLASPPPPLHSGTHSAASSAHATPMHQPMQQQQPQPLQQPPHQQQLHSSAFARSFSTPSPSSSQHRGASPSLFGSPPPLALGSHSAQFTNPYLSHTNFGGGAVTSGEGFDNDAAAHQLAMQQHAAAAAAAAAVASYYPYHALHGFMGAGFILGHASGAAAAMQQQQQHQQQQQQQQQSSSSPEPHVHHFAHSQTHAPLPVLGVSGGSHSNSASSSSCPSPLLTSTSERRRSKPHVQFVPPTHSVMPNGLVLPMLPPLASSVNGPPGGNNAPGGAAPPTGAPSAASAAAAVKHRSTSARVSHAFNLFGLPPIFVYEIRVPPHVYLLTALVLYGIGPPALIPLVAAFFCYRWHLQFEQANQAAADARAAQHEAAAAAMGGHLVKARPHPQSAMPATAPGHGGPSTGHLSALHKPNAGHPSGVPKVQPSPLLSQRKHPNIHSLYDS